MLSVSTILTEAAACATDIPRHYIIQVLSCMSGRSLANFPLVCAIQFCLLKEEFLSLSAQFWLK